MISVLQPVRVCVHLDPKFLSWIRNHPPKVKNPSAKNPEMNPQTNQPPKVKNPSAKNPGAYLHTAVRLYVYMCPPKETRSLEHIILKGQGLRVTRV